MFSDHDVAEDVLDLMQELSGKLNQSLIDFRDRMAEDEWKAYRVAVGKIMGEMFDEVMHDIGEKYPDLRRKLYGE